jgi:iduronate 2-sulfatase
MSSNFSREIRQQYYAATTYVDSLIGDVLEELSKSGHEQNTIIALLSDHGWSLGIL